MTMWFSYLFVLCLLTASWQLQTQNDGGDKSIFLASAETVTNFPPTVHRCVWAGNKLRKAGDGSTEGSCSSCDPTRPECPAGCQDLIDTLYWSCAEVSMPDGYYFDPQNNLDGLWDENLSQMKINVERCGCNSASKGATVSAAVFALAIGAAVIMAV